MSRYLAVFGMAFRGVVARRSAAWISLATSAATLGIQLLIWSSLSQAEPAARPSLIAYIVIVNVVASSMTNGISGIIQKKVTDGTIASELYRPTDIFWSQLAAGCGIAAAGFVLRGLPLFVVYGAAAVGALNLSWWTAAGAVLFTLVGVVLLNIIYVAVGFAALQMIEAGWLVRLLTDTIGFTSGALIPLSFYPRGLRSFCELLPFHLAYSLPARLLTESVPAQQFIADCVRLAFWFGIALGSGIIYSRRMVSRLVIQGG